jgi:PPOX class probable F420-dependent enzyme
MDADRARAFIRENHRAVLATRRASGDPQLSPVLCAVGADGRVLVSTREPAMKAKNVLRDRRVSLCVLNDGFFGDWIQVDGTAEVVSLPEAMELLVDYYKAVSGEHPDWDQYRAAMEREGRVVVRIDIDRAGPDRSG